MTTTAHVWGNDLTQAPQGGIAATAGLTASQQAVARRLCTFPGEYIFHPTYGAGLQRFVGRALSPVLWSSIKALILAQMAQEPTVANSPQPAISFSTDAANGLLSVTIQYTAQDGSPQSLTLPQV